MGGFDDEPPGGGGVALERTARAPHLPCATQALRAIVQLPFVDTSTVGTPGTNPRFQRNMVASRLASEEGVRTRRVALPAAAVRGPRPICDAAMGGGNNR
jgi:hypothetical protein